jgi:DNA-binding NarL/FixJ family response regulator
MSNDGGASRPMPITVAIIEDDPGTRAGLVALLESEADMRCLGAYRRAEEALTALPAAPPEVVLVDLNLPGMSGLECVGRLKTLLPEVPVLVLTQHEESEVIFDSLREGAEGYLLKKMLATELVPAIRQVLVGGAPMSMQIARRLVEYFHQAPSTKDELATLTPREQQLLELLARGHYYRELAEQLGVTVSTVRAHAHNVYRKLHVRSRAEATLKFLGRK